MNRINTNFEKEYENKFGNSKNCLYPFDQAIFENILKETN